MTEKNLEFTRIDDRLIHGQVITAWLHTYAEVRHVLVVDDEVSRDSFMQKMFALLVPSGTSIRILGVDDAVAAFGHGLGQPTMMIAKVPLTIKRLVDAGVSIDFVNIGGMGMSVGRKKFFQNIAVSNDERDIMRELIAEGMKLEIQIVPAQKKVDVASLLK